MYHVNVNVNFIVENIIQIKSGIMINVDGSVNDIIYVKKVNDKYLANIMDDSVITCDEIVDADAVIRRRNKNYSKKF